MDGGNDMIEKRQFYINGAWVDPAKARDMDVIDPSTEETCAVISLGDQADTDAAVAAAKAAFPAWAAKPMEERIELLKGLAKIYKERREDMAEAIRAEMGAPLDLAMTSQWGTGTWHMAGFLDALPEFDAEKAYKGVDRIRLEPIGVCGLITPWSWPWAAPWCSNRPRSRRCRRFCLPRWCMMRAFRRVFSTS
jgi:aldehyde dehydrogenase (NAD+)